ncbi:MAG TPA: prepilin peptidase [Gemmatimonadales bacterium]|jgi:leader peptidase (prepilin peptidase)/N-methyltransferase|nr:prepilin peptidase [Gemmatimonadales bacterium]
MNDDLLSAPWPVLVLAGVFGLLIGSFLNVCIARWPAEESVVRPRSRCPRCGNLIAWYDNIPVVSWLVLRAKCRHCHLPISWRYPAVELLVGMLWLACAWKYGWTVEALRAALFGTILIGIAFTDAREYIIPDEFSLGGTALGLLLAFVGGALPWPQALLGAAVGFALLWLIAVVGSRLLKQDAMGGGDIKMMAMIGAFLGWPGVLLTLFLGAALGTLIFLPLKLAGRERLVPFGVFLAIGAAACWIAGPAILDWYRVSILGV